MVDIVEGGDTWRLCSIEDKSVGRQDTEDQGKKVSVMSREGNNVKPEDEQLKKARGEGGNKSLTESKANPSSNSEEKEMEIEEKGRKEVEIRAASLLKEVPTRDRATTALKSGKESTKVKPMADVDQPIEESPDVNESGKDDDAEEPILVDSNPEGETQKAPTEKTDTKETTPIQDSTTRPAVNTPKSISETSVQATKVKESKIKSETIGNSEISKNFNDNEASRSKPEAEPDELFTSKESRGNSSGIISNSQDAREPHPKFTSIGSSESVSSEGRTVGRSNVMETTRSLFNRGTNLILPLERVSLDPANLRRLTTSNTPGSRLKPNVESTTSSYSITASPQLDEEKQLYPVGTGAKSTQSSVSTDLAKLPSAADQKEGIASKDKIALSGSEGKWKEEPGEANVDKSENGSGPKKDFPTPPLNFTERRVFDSQSKGSNEIEMTEVLLEEPIDSIELKQVMNAVLQEAKERESVRQKRGAGPGRRFGRARRGRKPRRKGAAAARHYVAGKSGREEPEYIVCMPQFYFSMFLLNTSIVFVEEAHQSPYMSTLSPCWSSLIRFPSLYHTFRSLTLRS